MRLSAKTPNLAAKLTKLSAAAVLVALLSPATRSQQSAPNPGTDPNNAAVQIISNSQFNQMVSSGELKQNNPVTVLEQFIGHVLQDLKNGATVQNFIRKNPNIPGYAQLVAAAPKNPNIHPTLDGNYRTVLTFNGVTQTIETFGPSAKLGALAGSITASTDPQKQLALYNLAYSQYATTYSQLCNTNLPPPTQTDIPPGQIDQQPSLCQQLV
ncbi:MAG TPA: hypothetical protein VHP80_11305, partial [Candidatus Acidoferrum sp.]|nr:hypothetical protein [Candidatus Acidoferrum sp.]